MKLTLAAAFLGAVGSCAAPAEKPPDPEPAVPPPPGTVVPRAAIYGSTESAFTEPAGVHFDTASGALVVADRYGHRVVAFDGAFEALWTLDRSRGIDQPSVVRTGPDGEVLVLDAESRFVKTFGPNGEAREPVVFPSPPGGPPLKGIGTFTTDQEGGWYVVDAERPRVLAYDKDLNLRYVLPSEEGEASFGAITGLAVADNRLLAVLDFEATPVQLFDRNGRFVGGFGRRNLSLEDFTTPIAACFDEEGRLHVVDLSRHDVKVYDVDGRFDTVYGGWYGAQGPHTEPGELLYPTSIAIDPDGRIYVSERYGNRVQVFERH